MKKIKITILSLALLLGLSDYAQASVLAVPEEYSSAIKIDLLVSDPDQRYQGKLYCLEYSDLIQSGLLNSSVDPRTIKIFNQGQEIDIYIEGEDDGKFNSADRLYFYAKSYTETRFTYTNVYWLVSGRDKGQRMDSIEANASQSIDTIHRKYHYERNQQHQSKFDTPDPWYFKTYVYAHQNKAYSFNIENLDLSSNEKAKLKIQFFAYRWGTSHPERRAYFYINGTEVGTLDWVDSDIYDLNLEIDRALLNDGNNTLNIKGSSPSSNYMSLIYLDYLELDYPVRHELIDGEINFANLASSTRIVELDGAQNNETLALAIADDNSPKLIESFSYTGTKIKIEIDAQNGNQYFVSTLAKAKNNSEDDLSLNKVSFSGLRDKSNQADYIAVYWSLDDLNSSQQSYVSAMNLQLERLLDYRQEQGLKVMSVGVNEIYNEFNAGIANPQALKDFFNYAYSNWKDPNPSYVVLIGDATYDYREDELYDRMGLDYMTSARESYKQVPTHMFKNKDIINNSEIGFTATDDWLVCFDGERDVFPEITIGRLPVRDADDLRVMIDKIISFEKTPIDSEHLKRISVFSGGEYDFERINDLIYNMTDGYTVNSLSPAGYVGSNFNQDLRAELSNGSLLVNYSGHGSIDLWGVAWDVANYGFQVFSSTIFQNSDVDDLNNKDMYQIYTALSCLNGYLLKPTVGQECLAERLLKEEDKGAVAMFASSGVSLPAYQRYMAEGFYDAIFMRNYKTLGAAVVRAKLYLSNRVEDFASNAAQSFMLFGDPALQIPLPIEGRGYRDDIGVKEEEIKEESAVDEKEETETYIGPDWGNYAQSVEITADDESENKYEPRPPVPPEGFGGGDNPFAELEGESSDVSYSAYLFDTALASGDGAYETGFGVAPEAGTSSSISLDKIGVEKKVLKEVRVEETEELTRAQKIERSKAKRIELVRTFFNKRKQSLEIPKEQMRVDKKESLWQRIVRSIKNFFKALLNFVRGLF